ncbi:hypothetical protein VM98_09275 [Streptomyces rubellomurinus subsp. indigoferus]|nr:hypothetical protein VM98_09275 [Streptomyces rubellomurinus subsp. indigoferus]
MTRFRYVASTVYGAVSDWWVYQVTGMRTLRKPSFFRWSNRALVVSGLPQEVSSGIASRVLPRFPAGLHPGDGVHGVVRDPVGRRLLGLGGVDRCGGGGAAGQAARGGQGHHDAGRPAEPAGALGLACVVHGSSLSGERGGWASPGGWPGGSGSPT